MRRRAAMLQQKRRASGHLDQLAQMIPSDLRVARADRSRVVAFVSRMRRVAIWSNS
jgi:hypothetical protein